MLGRFKRPFDDSKDKFAFFLAFFAGVLGLLFIRILGDQFFGKGLNIVDFLAIVWALAALIAYGGYILFTRDRSSISVDRASDNIYYLGLLYTLTSLAYSLIKLTYGMGDGTSFKGERILSLLPDFGLALFSTIGGIFGRILLQQMRNDPLDNETEAREELGRTVRELRETIGQVVSQLNGLSAQMRLSLTELNENVSSTLAESAQRSTQIIDGVSDGIGGLSHKLEDRIDEITTHSRETSEQFTQILEGLKNEFEKFSEIPASISSAFSQVSVQFTEVAGQVGETVEQQRVLATAMLRSTETINAVFAAEEWQMVHEQLEQTQKRYKDVGEEIGKFSEGLSGAKDLLNEKIEALSDAGKELGKVSDAVEETSKSVEEASQMYVEALSESAARLRDQTDDAK